MTDSFEEFLRKEREALDANIRSTVAKVQSLMSQYGVKDITGRYSGSGDDGYFYEILSDDCDLDRHSDLVAEVDNLGRFLLSRHYEGWELNQGSEGTLNLSLKDGKLGASIEHAWLELVEQPPLDALPAGMFDEPKNSHSDAPPGHAP